MGVARNQIPANAPVGMVSSTPIYIDTRRREKAYYKKKEITKYRQPDSLRVNNPPFANPRSATSVSVAPFPNIWISLCNPHPKGWLHTIKNFDFELIGLFRRYVVIRRGGPSSRSFGVLKYSIWAQKKRPPLLSPVRVINVWIHGAKHRRPRLRFRNSGVRPIARIALKN